MKKVVYSKKISKPTKRDNFSYSNHISAFRDVLDWMNDAADAKLIKPTDKFMKTLRKYEKICHKQVDKKPYKFL